MIKNFINNHRTILSMVLICFASLSAQGKRTPLETAVAVADKIVRESSFTFNLIPQTLTAGIQTIDLNNEFGPARPAVAYAYSVLDCKKTAEIALGVGGCGGIKIWLNGTLVYSNWFTNDYQPREIAYDLFRFPDTLRAKLHQGANPIMVKVTSSLRPWNFFLRILPENGSVEPSVTFSLAPIVSAKLDQTWLTLGAFEAQGDGKQLGEMVFPPEISFNNHYQFSGRTYIWNLPKRAMLPEFGIPADISFTSHSYLEWQYANGETMLALLELSDAIGKDAYFRFVQQGCNLTVEHLPFFGWLYDSLYAIRGPNYRIFRRIMLDDAGAPTLPFIELVNRNILPDAKPLVQLMGDFLMHHQMRLEDGTYCRLEPEDSTVWADDLFMSVPLLLRLAKMTGNVQYYDEAVRQIDHFDKWLYDNKSGLYHHGWYDQRQKPAPIFWGRANGWIVWAVSEALMKLPKDFPGYKQVLNIFRRHLAGVARYQNANGMWHQVLDHPESYEETSCTAMFVLAMARGVNNGWLEGKYRDQALRGWAGIQQHIDADGTVHGICQGTGIGDDLTFYLTRKTRDHDPRGLGAVLLAGIYVNNLKK